MDALKVKKADKNEPMIVDVCVLSSDRQLLIIKAYELGIEVYNGIVIDAFGIIMHRLSGLTALGVKKAVYNKLKFYLE